jgi:exosortase/archaeosortase family protein
MRKRKKLENPYKKESKNKVLFIFLRYLILLALIIVLILPINSPTIYLILTPLTIYPVVFLLKIFVNLTFFYQGLSPMILLGGKTLIEIVPACVAGAAYILLLALNLSVSMKPKKRILSLVISFLILLIFNIIRIFIFSLLYYNSVPGIDFTHIIFWYGVSTIFIVLIWFIIVKIFKIREIPIYSDMKLIIKEIRTKK